MIVSDILPLLSAGETLTFIDVNNGEPTSSIFRANNVPLRFWNRTIKELWNGREQFGFCIRLERE